MKKFILNACDLGKDEFTNNAILEGSKFGLLKSATIVANMPFFADAIHRVVQKNIELGIGIQLNLTEGKALNGKLKTLCDNNGAFKNDYLTLLLKSRKRNFLKEAEIEFRSQIEKVLEYTKITHIDSSSYIHSIPNIFELVAYLACEYNIPQIKTYAEIPYFNSSEDNIKDYLINLLKVVVLNYFTLKNKPLLIKQNIKTNDYTIGIAHYLMMSPSSILEELKKIKKAEIVEATIHIAKYYDNTKNSLTKEYEITQDEMLKDLIEELGYTITNYIEN